MIPFDESDPFPLLVRGSSGYLEEQKHAALVDAWLGLDTERLEKVIVHSSSTPLTRRHQLWIGLPTQALLTPYTEIRKILDRVNPRKGQTIVDLGAGYGRMGFVIGRHYPEVHFLGYEFVPERCREGSRCLELAGYTNAKLIEADLTNKSFRPIEAQIYFIYDFGSRTGIDKTLEDLREIAANRPITVIGRGRATRDAIERKNPWLSQVVTPQHEGNFSIYRSAFEAS